MIDSDFVQGLLNFLDAFGKWSLVDTCLAAHGGFSRAPTEQTGFYPFHLLINTGPPPLPSKRNSVAFFLIGGP